VRLKRFQLEVNRVLANSEKLGKLLVGHIFNVAWRDGRALDVLVDWDETLLGD